MINQIVLEQLLLLSEKDKLKYSNALKGQKSFYTKLLNSYAVDNRFYQMSIYLKTLLEDINSQINTIDNYILQHETENNKSKVAKPQKHPPNKSKYTTFGQSLSTIHPESTVTLQSSQRQNDLTTRTQPKKKILRMDIGYEETDDKSRQCIRGTCKGVRYLNSNYCRFHYDEEHHNSK